MRIKKNVCNNGSFEDKSGKSRNLSIDERSNNIKIDGKEIGVKLCRSSKTYLNSSNEELGSVSTLGNVVEFCKKYLTENPTFA